MSSAQVCYKYRSGVAVLRCLSEGTLYFASTEELNDSLEGNFDLASTQEYVRVFSRAVHELAIKRGHNTSFQSIEQLPHELEVVNREENERFRAGCKDVGIFSTARRPDNQPMWAYYCDNSKGVCFHLEFSEKIMKEYQLLPTPVTYTRDARILNRADDFREQLLKVGEQNDKWSIDQIRAFSETESFLRRVGISSIARAVSTKHADWEHEAEIRFIAPRSGPIPILKDVLKSVIFMRTDFPEWGSIMTLLHRLYPDVQLADLSFHHTEPFVRSRKLSFKAVPVHRPTEVSSAQAQPTAPK